MDTTSGMSMIRRLLMQARVQLVVLIADQLLVEHADAVKAVGDSTRTAPCP